MFHVLAFDRVGGRWRPGEVAPMEDAGDRLGVERMARERIIMSPGCFSVPVRVHAVPEVRLKWESPLRSAGVCYLSSGTTESALACLLLNGSDELAEEAVIRSVERGLRVAPGHPLCPGFATVRRDRRRPMLAIFRVGLTADPLTERALVTAAWGVASAYFGLYAAAAGTESATHATSPDP